MKKIEDIIILSENILEDIELNQLSLEQIIYKTMRLARFIDDYDIVKWLNLEIHWYSDKKIIPWIAQNDVFSIAIAHWRWVNDVDEKWNIIKKMRLPSIPEIETNIDFASKKLENLKLPSHYAPSSNYDSYNSIVVKIWTEQASIQKTLSTNKDILSRIKIEIYNYVLSINYKLKYSQQIENIFIDRQNIILTWLSNNIKYNEIFLSIQSNLISPNSTDRENAVHTCRKLLQLIADEKAPVDQENKEKIKDNKTIKLWAENYINRLIHYIENKSDSKTFKKITWSHLDFIWNRIDSIYEATNKWTHSSISLEEAKRYVIYTYLLVADIIEL